MPKHQLRLMMADQSVFGFGRVALKRLALKQSLHKKRVNRGAAATHSTRTIRCFMSIKAKQFLADTLDRSVDLKMHSMGS